MPTNLEFRRSIYVSGSYNGGAATAPILRTAAGTALSLNNPPNVGSHFSLSFPPTTAPRPLAGPTTTPYVSTGPPTFEPNSGGSKVPFVAPGGTLVGFLPFVGNMITSMIIPGNPASNVNFFYTDNLSGCSIFIDQIAGSNDLAVYHANRMDLTVVPNPAQYVATTPFANQYLTARNGMRNNHLAAQAELSASMHGVALNNVARLERATYFRCTEDEKTRKQQQGRTNVDMGVVGTNVMGFRVAGTSWEFWWQTWAIMVYDRPRTTPKGLFSPHKQLVLGSGKLLDAQRFHY